MSSVHDQFLGFAAETTYGTPVAPASFYEFNSEGITASYERIESEGIRAGASILRADRFAVNPKGAAGDVTLEVLDKGFDLLLEHAMGSMAGTTAKTFTAGPLLGKALTCQVGRVTNGGTLIPFTYSGGKVASWELSNSVDGILTLGLTLDFAKENAGAGAGALALAVPTYPASTTLFTFVSGSVQVAGTEFPVSEVTLSGDNGLKTDRYALRGANSTTKREPLEEGMREYAVSFEGEFDGLTHYNRVASATAAGAVATFSAQWTSPQGGILNVAYTGVRFDEAPVNVGGMEIITQSMSGKAVGSAPTITYTPAV